MATNAVVGGRILIYVHRLCEIPQGMRSTCIDVRNTCAQSSTYHLSEVTGANSAVQASLVTHVSTAQAIEDAVIQLELQRSSPERTITFVCDGGTHRSYGCGVILASLFYPGALIIPSTPRTLRDAEIYLREADS